MHEQVQHTMFAGVTHLLCGYTLSCHRYLVMAEQQHLFMCVGVCWVKYVSVCWTHCLQHICTWAGQTSAWQTSGVTMINMQWSMCCTGTIAGRSQQPPSILWPAGVDLTSWVGTEAYFVAALQHCCLRLHTAVGSMLNAAAVGIIGEFKQLLL